MRSKVKDLNEVYEDVRGNKITKPVMLYKDAAGNKLYLKYIKSRNRVQIYGTNAKNVVVDEESLAILMKRSGLPKKMKLTPISEKSRRMTKYLGNNEGVIGF